MNTIYVIAVPRLEMDEVVDIGITSVEKGEWDMLKPYAEHGETLTNETTGDEVELIAFFNATHWTSGIIKLKVAFEMLFRGESAFKPIEDKPDLGDYGRDDSPSMFDHDDGWYLNN